MEAAKATPLLNREAIEVANRQFKEASAKARGTYNAALRAAKAAFAADRKACTAGAPRAGEKEEKSVRVAMLPLNNSGEFGKATLKQDDGKVEAKLDLYRRPYKIFNHLRKTQPELIIKSSGVFGKTLEALCYTRAQKNYF